MNPDEPIQDQSAVEPTLPPFTPGPAPIEPVPPVSDLPGASSTIPSSAPTIIPPPTTGPPTQPPVPNTTVLQPAVTSQVAPVQPAADQPSDPVQTPPQLAPSSPAVTAPPVVAPLPDVSPVMAAPTPPGPVTPAPQAQSVTSNPSTAASQPPPIPQPQGNQLSALPIQGGPKKKPNIGLIVGIIAAALVLLGGVIFALSLLFGGFSKVNTGGIKSDTLSAKTAESIADYAALCDRGKITNAADFGTKPHKIVPFQSSALSEENYTESIMSFKNKTWEAESSDLTSVQLVACMKRTSPTVSKKCDLINDKKQNVSIDYYSVTYQLTVYEAKTGKSRLSATVPGPADKCPYSVLYNPNDPKIYADPDKASFESAITPLMGT